MTRTNAQHGNSSFQWQICKRGLLRDIAKQNKQKKGWSLEIFVILDELCLKLVAGKQSKFIKQVTMVIYVVIGAGLHQTRITTRLRLRLWWFCCHSCEKWVCSTAFPWFFNTCSVIDHPASKIVTVVISFASSCLDLVLFIHADSQQMITFFNRSSNNRQIQSSFIYKAQF